MSDLLPCLLSVLVVLLAWLSGYHFGKVDGIREVRHLMDEQWKDYESFRDLVFRELGIKGVDE